jgi:hypothetical protein
VGPQITRCTNCGTQWNEATDNLQKEYEYCPVCNLRLTAEPHEQDVVVSSNIDMAGDFAGQLRNLIQEARTAGLSEERISEALRDELAFVAELARPDRRHYVQVIDIGPSEGLSVYVAPADARQALQRRTA